jgi:hypothetical protein
MTPLTSPSNTRLQSRASDDPLDHLACCIRRRCATRCCASRPPASTTCRSERILGEAEHNLVADGRVDASGARRLRNAMMAAFDDAIVPDEAVARLEGAMTNDRKDGHVLAAAVRDGL